MAAVVLIKEKQRDWTVGKYGGAYNQNNELNKAQNLSRAAELDDYSLKGPSHLFDSLLNALKLYPIFGEKY